MIAVGGTRGLASLGTGMFPVLFALFMNLAITPFWYVLYSGSPDPPWPGALGVLALGAYLITKMVGVERRVVYMVLLLLGWGAGVLTWVVLEPGYGLTNLTGSITLSPVLRSMVLGIWSLVAWWVGMRYATHPSFLSPGAVRMATVWGWAALVGGVVVAALMGSDADLAVRASVVVVPLAMVSWVALMTLGELHRRGFRLGRREGSVSPVRHWLGTVGVAVIGTTLVSAAAVLLLPSLSGGEWTGVAGQWLSWLMNGVYRVVGPLVVFIGNLALSLFNDPDSVTTVNLQNEEIPPAEDPSPGPIPDDPDSMVWVFVVIALVVLVGIVLIWARRRVATVRVDDIEVRRSNVFTVNLVADQIGTLLRRYRGNSRSRRDVDLSRLPSDVRQAWAHLETLAAQRGSIRQPNDTVRDFAGSISDRWPTAGDAVGDLSRLYERTHYGGEAGHDEPALRAWSSIRPVLTGDGGD